MHTLLAIISCRQQVEGEPFVCKYKLEARTLDQMLGVMEAAISTLTAVLIRESPCLRKLRPSSQVYRSVFPCSIIEFFLILNT